MEKDSFGILILAFGDRGYHYAAYNLCLSIKHKNPNLKVAIFCDNNNHVDYKQCRADIIKVCDYFGAEPGLNKINALSDLPFTNTLYLDADGFCMKDLRPLIDDLLKQNRFFMCDIFGSGNFGVRASETEVTASKTCAWALGIKIIKVARIIKKCFMSGIAALKLFASGDYLKS